MPHFYAGFSVVFEWQSFKTLGIFQLEKHKKHVHKWRVKHEKTRVETGKRRTSGFMKFASKRSTELLIRANKEEQDKYKSREMKTNRTRLNAQLMKEWQEMEEDSRRHYEKKAAARCPDPAASIYRPDAHFGSVVFVLFARQ